MGGEMVTKTGWQAMILTFCLMHDALGSALGYAAGQLLH